MYELYEPALPKERMTFCESAVSEMSRKPWLVWSFDTYERGGGADDNLVDVSRELGA